MWTKLSPHCFEKGCLWAQKRTAIAIASPSFHLLSIATVSNQINPEIWLGILLWLKPHGAPISLKLFGKWVEASASSCHALKMYLSYVAEVLVRSSYPGQGLQWKQRCIWFSPEAEKLDEAVSPPTFPFTDPVICATALALQTGKCQSQISLPPKALCARFSALRYPDQGLFYFKWNTHTKQTFSRSSRCVLSVLWQEPFSSFRKKPRTHLCLITVNSMGKNFKKSFFFKKNIYDIM